jgi:ankyrin repeat protein
VCHTCVCNGDAARTQGLVSIARRLLALGANANAIYTWRWHPELPRTALWGALFGTRHLTLAEALLDEGADPTDGVSTHIAAGAGDLAALELLQRHGVNVNGKPGGLPPLVYILGYATNPAGPRWLLEHGADANLPWTESGESPLHVAARRWDVAMVGLLVKHGADLRRRRVSDGRTPHTLAELHGNHAIATWLLAHGAKDELSSLEHFIAACARGDRARADAMLRSQPSLRGELQAEHHLMLHRPAESGDAAVLETMLACGFDPHVKDKDGVTALHRAAMAGHADAVRVLLAFGAPLNALDGMFSATPLVWAAEGWSHDRSAGADHPAVARLLIAAGSALEWTAPENSPGPERVQETLIELRRAAAGDEHT